MVNKIMSEKIALLIDVENTSDKYVEDIFSEINKYGKITVKRMYGDFSSDNIREWAKKGLENAIVPIHQNRYTASKNASDIMLVIDAMDILFQDLVDIFCIVSSDSDFTRLASRLREGGKKVIGMGKSNASKTFITACDEYKFLDKISSENVENVENDTEESSITSVNVIKNILNRMMQNAENDGHKLNMGSAKSQLQKEISDFDERNYGYTSFRKFIESETRFSVEIEGSTAFIMRKGQK